MTRAVAGEALADAGVTRPGELHAVGITNQRETVCVWDPETGEPLHRAIVWQDRRTATRCDELREQGHERLVRDRTGLVLDPYFSATKIEWLLGSVDGLRDRARSGRAMFGTVDAWLIYKLTGERATDASNASRTMLFDIAAGDWDPELLDLFGIPAPALPRGRPKLRVDRDHRCRRAARTRGPDRRRRRRSAGGAVRTGVRRSRARQEHLRHGLVRAAERGLHGASRSPMDCSQRSPGGSASGSRTRSKRRSSSPARRCSGCATASGIIELGLRHRAAGGVAARQRRRLLRSGADRARISPIGIRTRAARSSA